ncbi:MAG TPA: class I SAM-dependent methyltransferase [Candidatus Acidoferrum sp.]|nr:class I SAM-dependent methyltransferase [Candidatus Acidoferrum sp.]
MAEPKLRDRHKLAFDWLPEGCQRVLDGGCAFGYGTAPLAAKAREVCGCDPNPELIAQARASYPAIAFETCPLEKTPYDHESFDAVVLTDVLEHVADERATLNELFRVLKPGGCLIITTPHKGLFAFMDPDNYAWHLRTKAPRLYRRLFRMKHGRDPSSKVGYESEHRHYRLEDFIRLLEGSAFRGRYEVDRVFRGGLFLGPLSSNLYEALSILAGTRFAAWLLRPLAKLCDWDYFVGYGKLSYNIGIRVVKRT